MLSTKVNNARDSYPEYQRAWLKKQLEIARNDNPRKPIFLFHHPNIRGTVFGHEDWSNPGIESIVANFPQVIDFSGHSHYPINAPTSIYQGLFTALNTGGFHDFDGYNYYKLSPIRISENYGHASQFYFVEADAFDHVRIYPYDAISRSFFPMVWKIDKAYDPSSYLYTNKIRYSRKVYPYFTDGAQLRLGTDSDGALVFSFPQAHIDAEDEYVKEYRYMIRTADDGIVRVQTGEWSGFHLQPMPDTVVSRVTGLDFETRYTLEVQAVSFWEKTFETSLTADFVLQALPVL